MESMDNLESLAKGGKVLGGTSSHNTISEHFRVKQKKIDKKSL